MEEMFTFEERLLEIVKEIKPCPAKAEAKEIRTLLANGIQWAKKRMLADGYTITEDELLSLAGEALHRAKAAYDPAKASLQTHFNNRIWGACRDAVKAVNTNSRTNPVRIALGKTKAMTTVGDEAAQHDVLKRACCLLMMHGGTVWADTKDKNVRMVAEFGAEPSRIIKGTASKTGLSEAAVLRWILARFCYWKAYLTPATLIPWARNDEFPVLNELATNIRGRVQDTVEIVVEREDAPEIDRARLWAISEAGGYGKEFLDYYERTIRLGSYFADLFEVYGKKGAVHNGGRAKRFEIRVAPYVCDTLKAAAQEVGVSRADLLAGIVVKFQEELDGVGINPTVPGYGDMLREYLTTGPHTERITQQIH